MKIKSFKSAIRPAILLSGCLFVFFGLMLAATSGRAVSPVTGERNMSQIIVSVPDSLSKVYVCTGSKAYAYHTVRGCEFLNNCGARIDTVTLKTALTMGRKQCKSCLKSGR